ncbi:MAG: alpha/beta hydrolase [Bacteroidota bacterium]
MILIEAILHKPDEHVRYSEYGAGQELLLAFHGYGMNGLQFEALPRAITSQYRVIGFHLPYHKYGASSHNLWLEKLPMVINELMEAYEAPHFSLMGYSVGAKIALHILQLQTAHVKKVHLIAPYGLETHWGLDFVTGKVGNSLFQAVLNSKLPLLTMRLAKSVSIIDQDMFMIIAKELASTEKRQALCNTLEMIGEIELSRATIVQLLNDHAIPLQVYYGTHDSLFPYKGRNQRLLKKIEQCIVVPVNAGHWLVTQQLDEKMAL